MKTLRTFLATLALLVATSVPVSGQILPGEPRAVVPVVGSTAGAFGANFKTELQLHNGGSSPMNGTLVFRAQGQPGSPDDASLVYELAPFETKHYADVVAEMGAEGLGSLDIIPDTGSKLPIALFRAFDDKDENGTTGVTVPMVLVSKALTAGKSAALIVPSNLTRFRFNIGVRSLSDGAVLAMTVYDADGTVAETLPERSYPANYFEQRPAKELFEVEPDQTLAITVVSGRAIVYGTTTDNRTNDGSVQIDEIFNSAPVVADPDGDGSLLIVASTSSGEPVTISATVNDEDGDPLTYGVGAEAANGSLGAIIETGAGFTIVYTPRPGFIGEDEFTITIGDGEDTITIIIRIIVVAPGNTIPTAENTTATTLQGMPVDVTMTGSDPDDDTLAFSIATPPTNGALSSITAIDGTHARVTYTPNPGFSGSDSFEFKVDDGRGGIARATVAITVTPVENRSPVATDQTVSTTLDTPASFTLLATDPDGDPLSYTIDTSPANGTLSGTAPNLTYTPASGFSGNDSFTWSVSDGRGGSDSAIVTLSVAPASNTPPVAQDRSVVTDEDTAVSLVLVGSDADGDPITYVIGASPSFGSISGTAPNLTYTPNPDFNGADQMTYVVDDGTTSSNTAIVTITVRPVNDAPVASADSFGTPEDTPLNAAAPGVLGNDSDVDGDTLSVSLETSVTNGTLALNGDGSFTYTPAVDFHGVDTFSYRVSDGNGGTAMGAATITVTSVNDVPVADDGAVATAEDSPVAVTLTGSDLDGDVLGFSVVSPPANGVLSGTAPNLTYTPNPDFNGSDSFTFTVSDGAAVSNVATVSVTVTPVNDAPVADSQAVTLPEDTPLAIVLSGSDIDGDGLVFSISSPPANGTLSGTAPNVTYTPNPNYNGADSFTFVVNDGTVDSSQATVTINVTPVNDVPVAFDDTYLVDEGGVLDIAAPGILGNDPDVEGTSLTATLVASTTSGTLTLNADGSFTYVHDGSETTSDSFTYTASDGMAVSNVATVTITVNPVNDAPVLDLDADDSGGTAGSDYAITFTENDPATLVEDPADAIITDGDSASLQTLTVTLTNLLDAGAELLDANLGATPITKNYDTTTDPTMGVLTLTGPATLAEFEAVLRTVTYRNTSDNPDTTPRVITFIANDGTDAGLAATATVTIVAQNDAPVADDATFSVDENSANGTSVGTVTASDLDGDTLTYAITGGTGAAVFAIDASTGEITVTDVAQLDFETTTSFALTVEVTDDGTGLLSDTASITINLNDVDEQPVFSSPASPGVTENTTAVVTVAATDPEAQTVTYSITGGADAALFSIDTNTGALTFNSAPDFENPADADTDNVYLVDVTATDGTTNAVQNLTVTVTDEDEAPSFTSSATPSVVENNTAVVTVVASDPEGQTLSYSITGGADAALFSINVSTGALAFVASPDFENPADADTNNIYLVEVTVTDGTNPVAQNLTVTVTDVNEAPSITSSATPSVAENTTAVVTVTTTDPEGDTVTYSITGGADAALFSIDTNTGALSFVSAPDFEAPTDADTNNVYVVSVTATDGTSPVVQNLVVTVTDVNEAPSFTSSATPSVAENATAVTTVVASDPEGQTLSYSITGGADAGLFSINASTGALSFAAAPDFEAPTDADTNNIYLVEVTVTDGTSPVVQNLTVTVTDVNEAPSVTSSATPSVAENTTAVVTVTTTDPEGDTVTYSITGGADAALFSIDTNTGALSFLSAPDFENPTDGDTNNVYLLSVTATDGTSPVVQNLTVTVTGVDEMPVFSSSATPNVAENTTPVVTVSATDPEGATVTYSITGGADAALFSIDTNTGALAFVSAPDFEAPADANTDNSYLVEVTATDGTTPAVQSLSVAVTDVNETPVFTSSTTPSVAENTSAVLMVTVNDPEGDSITYSISGGADALLFTIDPNTGALSFNTAPDFESPSDTGANNVYDVVVQASDGTNTPTQSISVTVTNTDEGPMITSSNTATFDENATGTVTTVVAVDPEGDTVTFAITGGADSGDLSIDPNTGAITFNVTPDFEAPADADTNNTYVIDVTATSSGGTDVQTITITINDVNDPPTITSSATASFPENGTGTVHTVTATDPESDTVSFAITGGTDSGDLAINPTTGAITFNVTPDFETPVDADANNTYVIEVTATATGGTDLQTITITVTNVNEQPSITSGSTANVNENATAVLTVAANDPDAGTTLNYSIVGGADQGDFSLHLTTGALTFSPAPNFEAPADSDLDNVYVVTVRASDGALFDDQTITVTVINVNEAPIAGSDTYTALGNTQLRVAGATGTGVAFTTSATGLLANDSDPDSLASGFANLTTAVATPPANGTVTMDTGGSFTYISNAGYIGADNFTYTLSDGTNNVTGTINLTVSETVWYVHDTTDATNNPAAGDTGRSTNAYDSIAELNAANATTADDYIFIFNGNSGTTPYSGTITLKTGQKLYGEGYGLIVPTFGTVIAAGTAPRISTAADVVTVPATAGSLTNVEIRGLNLTSTSGNAIDVTTSGANSASVTISNNTISGATAEGIDINQGSTGTTTAAVSNNTVTSTGTGIDLTRTVGTLVITAFADNSVTGSTVGSGIVVNTATFDAVPGGAFGLVSGGSTVIGVSGNGVGLSGMTLNSVSGDLSFTDLDIFADGGSGLTVSGTGAFTGVAGTRVTVGAGVGIIEATGGPAVSLSALTTDLQLTSLKATNTTSTGVSLTNVSDGTTNAVFSAGTGSTITTTAGATGPIFNVSGGNADIAYGGTIVNSSAGARAVSLTSWSGDDVTDDITLSGAITENGAGILVNGNAGSRPITFSGGLTISTTIGEGFAATSNTNSGGLHITGTNTINSTSATALRVTSTTIGASNVTFQRISSGNATVAADPANGIVLNNTGTTGRLIVTGNGGTCTSAANCTGGVIQNTTGDGISLTSTGNPSFSNVYVGGSLGHGINVSGGNTGMSLTNCHVENAGNADNEYGLNLLNILGTVTVTGTTFNNAADDLVHVSNNGNLTLNVTGSTFTYPLSISATANAAISLQPTGNAAITASITGSTFTNIKGSSAQLGSTTLNANATHSFTFTGNTVNSNVSGATGRAGGVSVSGQELTTTNVNIASNNFTGAGGNGVISVDTNDSSLVAGTISNNAITTPPGIGMFVAVDEGAETRLTLNANTITNSGGDGIQVVNFGGVGVSDLFLAITNNLINGHSLNTAVNFVGGISITSFEDNACVELKGNSVTNTPASPTQCGGAPCVDYYIEEVGGVMNFEEVPNTADTTLNAAYVNSTNDPGPVTIFGVIDLTNGAQCPFP